MEPFHAILQPHFRNEFGAVISAYGLGRVVKSWSDAKALGRDSESKTAHLVSQDFSATVRPRVLDYAENCISDRGATLGTLPL